MPQSKKLNLDQALAATAKPLARFGDLIAVQVFSQLRNHSDFPNGEMRSIFTPDQRDFSILAFPRAETEAHLRNLYADGGWIESVADLSDKELALYYGYMAGIHEPGRMAGNAGDPRQFEEDFRDALSQLPEGESAEARELVRRVVLQMHRKHLPDADRGRAHSDRQSAKAARKRPVKNESGETLDGVIGTLNRLHHGVGPGEMWTHLKNAIEDWSDDIATESGHGDSCCYRFTRPDDTPDTIKFSTFRKKLAALRR